MFQVKSLKHYQKHSKFESWNRAGTTDITISLFGPSLSLRWWMAAVVSAHVCTRVHACVLENMRPQEGEGQHARGLCQTVVAAKK